MSLHISYNLIVFNKKHSFINSQIPIFTNKYKFFSFFFSSLPTLRSKASLFSSFSFSQIQKPNSSRTSLFYFTNFFSALQFFKFFAQTFKLSSEYLPSKYSRSTSIFLTPYPISELNTTVSEFFYSPNKNSISTYDSTFLLLFPFRILFIPSKLLFFLFLQNRLFNGYSCTAFFSYIASKKT